MSGTPKRLHEEGSHSTPLKRPQEEGGLFSAPGKLVPSTGSDFRLPFESGQDGRLAKIQRVEPRDVDKRSSLLHRMTPSPGNYLDHPVTAENRSDLRSSKDPKDVRVETRETIRELYADPRIDRQGSIRGEKDTRLDTRGDEKEVRSDRGPHGDFKVDVKSEKDSYTATSSHLSWKEAKEHHKGKKYFEPLTDGSDSWRVARYGLHSTTDVSRNVSTIEVRDSLEAREAVGENKVDMKGEEKFREKDRKKKDEKHRDFGERDKDKIDQRNSLQVGVVVNEYNEQLKEGRETDRWERERNDTQKDKECIDKDKDPNMGEPSNANEKEVVGGSARTSDKEIISPQQQQHKDDSCSVPDRDIKEKGRGVAVDAGDKHEKRGNCYDKESDDGYADGDTERNGEAFMNGVQQRKRMVRSRGTPQGPQRRSRPRDNEGSQGQQQVSLFFNRF